MEPPFGVVVLNDACVTWPCSVLPLRPQLTDFSFVVAMDVGIMLDGYTDQDVVTISNIMKQRFATLLDVPTTDVRILSEKIFQITGISRFSKEIRVPTEQAGLVAKALVKSSSTQLALEIKGDVAASKPKRSVQIVAVSLATIVDSVVKEPMSGSALAGITTLVSIVVVGAIAMCFFCFHPFSKVS